MVHILQNYEQNNSTQNIACLHANIQNTHHNETLHNDSQNNDIAHYDIRLNSTNVF